MSRERRLARLARLHAEWVARHADDVPAPPEEFEDGALHHVDLGAPPAVEAEFQRTVEEIFPPESDGLDATEPSTDAPMETDWLRGAAAMADLRTAFAKQRLSEPRIPDGLVSALTKQQAWCWATRRVDPVGMYKFDRYLDEMFRSSIEGEPLEDYVAVSYAGHGVNSYFLTYQLVLGRVAVFVQIAWGGAYMDVEECRLRVGRAFGGVAALLEAAQPLLDASGSSGSRLVVLTSERPVGAVGWLENGGFGLSTVDAWREEHAWQPDRVLARALDLVLEAG